MLHIDWLVERASPIEQGAYQATLLPVGVFGTAWTLGKLDMCTGLFRNRRRVLLPLALLVHAITIVYTDSHSHFVAHIIEALSLTIHSNGGRDGDTICIFLCLNRALVCRSTLEASAKWSFKGGLETLRQESEERISRCRVR